MRDISGESASISLRAFVSQLSPPEAEWPSCYVVVDTEPEHWMATLPLDEIVEIIESRGMPPLRGIPWRWDAHDLVVEFGPVHLWGTGDEWLSLARRLIDAARSAGQLYEAPGTRPWSGPSEDLRVTELAPGEQGLMAHRGENRSTSPLAKAGGFSDDEFLELFGLDWRPALNAQDSGRPETLLDQVYLWGEPVQLAALVSPSGLSIGQPAGQWVGHEGVTYEAVDLVPVSGDMPRPMIETFVKERLRRRRRSFTWCRYCGNQLVPEARYDRETCFGCATFVFGVVY